MTEQDGGSNVRDFDEELADMEFGPPGGAEEGATEAGGGSDDTDGDEEFGLEAVRAVLLRKSVLLSAYAHIREPAPDR